MLIPKTIALALCFIAFGIKPQQSGKMQISKEIASTLYTASASSSYSEEIAVKNIINSSGMKENRYHNNHPHSATMWHTVENPTESSPANGLPSYKGWVRFDFISAEKFDRILIWNHNQKDLVDRGFKMTQFYGTTDGKKWKLLTETELPMANGEDGDAIEVKLDLKNPLKALIIAGLSNWGGNAYGLSEVKFISDLLVNEYDVPFPSDLECKSTPVYRRCDDGKLGREVKLQFKGNKLFTSSTLEVIVEGRISLKTIPFNKNGFDDTKITLPSEVGMDKDIEVGVTLKSGSNKLEKKFNLPKQRQWIVYIYPHSHVDIGYTNTQENVEIIHKRNIVNAIELAKKTAKYPEGARYLWNTEVSWPVERYLKTATTAERDVLVDAIRKEWINVEAGYIHDNTSVSADEELDALFAPSKTIEKLTGVKSDVMVQVDIPGISWGIVPAANRNGIRYCLLWNNGGDRVGRSMDISFRPFWWIGQDGKSKVLFLQPGAYTPGAHSKGHLFWPKMMGGTDINKILQIVQTDKPRNNFIDDYLWPKLESLQKDNEYPYDIFPMSWAMADNMPIDADLPEAVKSWNEEYAYPRLIIASAKQIMRAFETKYGNELPRRTGEFTEYWSDGLGSAAKQTAMNRSSKERLIQANTLWSMLHPGKPAPQDEFNEAWRYIILGSEHTWCYSVPQRQPLTNEILKVKFSYFDEAQKRSEELLERTIQPITAEAPSHLTIFNTLSWQRTGLVKLPYGINGLKDVPTQKLSNGETVFLAKNVPALSSKSYQVSKEAAKINQTIRVTKTTLDNGIVKVSLDPATGDIISIIREGVEFVETKANCRVNSYRYLYGNDKEEKAIAPTDVKISVEGNGPVLASLLVESKAEGCKWLKREIRIMAGLPNIEIINTLDKMAETKKEGIHFGFAFDVPNPIMRADIPWGIIEIEKDQMPEANRNWICFQRWLNVSNENKSVTWSSPDAPTFEAGNITANIIGHGSYNDWLKKIEPTATIYSWALNNHWHTNFPLSQEGVITLNYQILPNIKGYDAVTANRFGMENSRPLIATQTKSAYSCNSPLMVDNPRIVVSSIKNIADGKAMIVCLRSVSDKNEKAGLSWPAKKPKSVRLTDAIETIGEPVSNTIELSPYEVVTLRVEL